MSSYFLKQKILILVVCISVSGTYVITGQESRKSLEYIPYSATHYTGDTGIPQYNMDTVIQDKFGFIYFSTRGEGLFRYDGSRWRQYSSINADLADDTVVHMVYDGGENIYLAHDSEVITVFNVTTERSKQLTIETSRTGIHFSRLFTDSEGFLYLSTLSSGMYRYNPETGDTAYIPGSSTKLQVFGGGWIYAYTMFEDSKTRLWTGSRAGVILSDNKEVRAYYYYEDKKDRPVIQIAELADGTILVFTGRYLGYVDEKAGFIREYTAIKPFTEKMKIYQTAPGTCFSIDARGRYLLFTTGGGVVFEPGTGRSYSLTYENGYLVHNYVYNVFTDREKNIWISTQRGLTKLRFPSFYNIKKIGNISVSNANINDESMPHLKGNRNGAWLFFKEDSIIAELHKNEYSIIDYTRLPENAEPKFIGSYNSRTYIHCYNAVKYFYDPGKSSFNTVKRDNTLAAVLDDGIAEYRLYKEGSYTHGILRIDKNSGKEEILSIDPHDFGYYMADFFFDDGDMNKIIIIVQSSERGAKCYIYDLEKREVSRIPLAANIQAVLKTRVQRDQLTVITGGGGFFWTVVKNNSGTGILQYRSGTFTDFSTTLDLPGKKVEDVKVDQNGRLLIATGNNGLFVYDDGVLKKYTTSEGLDNNQLAGGISVSNEGAIYVMTRDTLSILDDSSIQEPVIDLIFFLAEDLNGKLPSIALQGLTGSHRFAPGFRDLKLYVSANTYLSERELKYCFRLKGRDVFHTEPDNRNYINLASLSPGKHEIEAHVIDHMDRTGKTTLMIEILPYWYERIYFRIGLTLILLLLLAGVTIIGIRLNTRRLQQKTATLEKIIKKKSSELKKNQTRLIQAEKLASLGRLTSRIAHELKNPLNFIINFSKLIPGSTEEVKNIIKRYSNLMSDDDEHTVKILLEDLAGDSGEVFRNGKRADKILKKMFHQASANSQADCRINAIIAGTLKEALNVFKAVGPGCDVLTKEEYDQTIPVFTGNEAALARVFNNIFDNALYSLNKKLKRIPGHEALLHIKTLFNNNHILISVEDNGTGMPRDIVDKVFEPFFTTKPPNAGTGLGLKICYDVIVTGLGGHIHCDSREGEGTVITLEWDIPLQEE